MVQFRIIILILKSLKYPMAEGITRIIHPTHANHAGQEFNPSMLPAKFTKPVLFDSVNAYPKLEVNKFY